MSVFKDVFSRIWFPAVIVTAAALQTFGMDVARTDSVSAPFQKKDTVIYDNSRTFSKFRSEQDRQALQDSALSDTTGSDTVRILTARDTIHAPDSLRETDPFRYKYYVALLDSLTHVQVRDSLKAAGDSLDWPRLDSLYKVDSTVRARIRFEQWYAGLSKKERKDYDFQQKMKRRQAEMDSILTVKDSLQAIKDSIRENTPRILSTFAVPDSMQYKRIISWRRDPLLGGVRLREVDTSYNYWFNDYVFMREDVNASYLGISGSAVQLYDAFKRDAREGVSFYQPYEIYSFSPSSLPMYNTKTPYTELAYWGTLFADTQREESNLHILTTQNIFPELNFMLEYDRAGANGMLENEAVDNRSLIAAGNYMGKRYLAHGGYIYNKVARNENGGIIDSFWIRDTTVGSREIDVRLSDASTLIKKNTVFLDQTLRIPFSFIKDLAARKGRAEPAPADTLPAPELLDEETDPEAVPHDTLDRDVTTAFIGHSSEYSVYRKIYKDNIPASDADARSFYGDRFYLNPLQSADSLRVMKWENKVFLKLQPWSEDAIVSSVTAGIGDRLLSYYMAGPRTYLERPSNTVWNSAYLYGGAGGNYREYARWSASGYYTFLGEQMNDTGLRADANLRFYPFRRYRKSPLDVDVHFETTLREPEFYEQHYYSNHFKWENDFGKVSTTRLEGTLRIPHWGLEVNGGYSLLSNNIYYDTLGVVRQNGQPMSVAKLSVTKHFRLWKFHFDNRALLQVSSNEEVMPLPLAALNLKWYMQLDIRKVLAMQLGVNGTYTTRWYAPAWNPAVGQFHNQHLEKFGDCPYFDVFVNMQWKRACIFVKLVNAGMGWPMESADYFSAAGYIRPQRSLKLGVYWPFYLQPRKVSTMSSRAGGTSGGAAGSNGAGGGMGGMMRGR